MYRVWGFLTEYSLLLVLGALIALVWANTDPHSYHHFVETPLWVNDIVGAKFDYWVKAYGEGAVEKLHGATGERVLSLHYLINDVLMAFFFAIAGKEVWEAVALKSGSLRGRKALTPLIATSGGMFGPIAVYLGLAAVMGSETYNAVANGWAIPTATDIAFSYLVGRLIFGAGHPAVRFLLLLAIADDAAGLIILAVFYPSGDLAPSWLLFSFGAAIAVYVLANWLPRRMDRGKQERPTSTWVREKLGFWPYALAGALCWYGFQESGIHPALGLLPIVATIPHADRAFGIFAAAEEHLTDLLNHIEHMLKHPVEVILFFFGLANAGCRVLVDRRRHLAGASGPDRGQALRHPPARLDRRRADAPRPARGDADHRPLHPGLHRGHRLHRVALHRLGRLRSRAGAGRGQDGRAVLLRRGGTVLHRRLDHRGREAGKLTGGPVRPALSGLFLTELLELRKNYKRVMKECIPFPAGTGRLCQSAASR